MCASMVIVCCLLFYVDNIFYKIMIIVLEMVIKKNIALGKIW